jgi:hypothetical protein
VIYEDRLLTVGGIPAWLLTVGGTLVLAGAGVTGCVLRSRRRSARAAETPIG